MFVCIDTDVVVLFCTEEGGLFIWTVNVAGGAPEETVATGVTPGELLELPGVLVAAGLPLEDDVEGVEVPVDPLFPAVTGFVGPLFPIPLLLADDEAVPPVPGVLPLPPDTR
jgi:hypothetical protein